VASSFFFSATVIGHNYALYNTVDISNDSYNLTLSVVLKTADMPVLPNTLLALLTPVWQSLSQLLLLVT